MKLFPKAKKLRYSIAHLFSILVLVAPLLFIPLTIEVFELNKMLFTYAITVVICFLWAARMITENRLIFRRTIIDIPLLVFIVANIISTIFSIDAFTSIFGYYSRLNGGLLSIIAYSLLYWAYVSNCHRREVLVHFSIIAVSAVVTALWAILEHYGIGISCLFVNQKFDTSCWVQDVTLRPFATLGQPNWLAAWLAAASPILWYKSARSTNKKTNWLMLSVVIFIALIFTKSRSGLLAYSAAFTLYWGIYFLNNRISKIFVHLLVGHFAVIALFGTPWTPSLQNLLSPPAISNKAAEPGGTESGEIRLIVWKGALITWKENLLVGTGPETFAYSYYKVRPTEHNTTSEWDLLYNKAHNEFLNYLANTGTLGFLAYTFLIIFSLASIKKSPGPLKATLMASYISILITNFFGFSVVVSSILFFLLPAMAISFSPAYEANSKNPNHKALTARGSFLYVLTIIVAAILLLGTILYWYSDYLIARANSLSSQGIYKKAQHKAERAVTLFPSNPLYKSHLAQIYAQVAVDYAQKGSTNKANNFADMALWQNDQSISISPHNPVFRKAKSNTLTDLAIVDQSFLAMVPSALEDVITLAPNDPKAHYHLGLAYERVGNTDYAVTTLEKTVALKPDYKEARLALALIYKRKGSNEKALEHLNFIINKISPDDVRVQELIDEIEMSITDGIIG